MNLEDKSNLPHNTPSVQNKAREEEDASERSAVLFIGFLVFRVLLAILFLVFLLLSDWGRALYMPK